MAVFSSFQKYFFSSVVIVSISSPSFGCANLNQNLLSPEIYQHWVHSYEEDVENVQVYRSNDYDFPPSRGREGFEIKENRQFILYSIGATDRPQAILGSWESINKTKIKVYLAGKQDQSFTLEVVELSDQYLKILKTFE